MKLKGKVALVTGASKGIGAEIAREFASEGAKVAVNYARDEARAGTVVKEIEAGGGQAIAVQGDVRKKEDVARVFAEVKGAFGPVDIVVNNAGIYQFLPLEAVDEKHYRDHFDINVFGLLQVTQEAVKQFAAPGNIINISSIVGLTPAAPNGLVYSATKAAVESITRGLAIELSGKARVNGIAPGMVETEGLAEAGSPEEFKQFVLMRSPVKRLGQPADIAKAAVYLASDDSSWVSGETLVVGGGFRM